MPPAFDTSLVSPSDAGVTLRSLRRRFAELFLRPDVLEAPGDPLHRRPADGGLSPLEHASWTAAALTAIGQALRHVVQDRDPRVVLPPVDVAPPVEGGDLAADEVVAAVGAAADALAELIAGIHGAEWTRTARVVDGAVEGGAVEGGAVAGGGVEGGGVEGGGVEGGAREVTALDIARLAVRIGVEHLRAAEQALGGPVAGDNGG